MSGSFAEDRALNVLLADPTGFCFGVRRAIEALEKALEEHGRLYSLGSPIHNPQEVARLQKKGLEVVEKPSEVPAGEVVFIRAHGVAPQVEKVLLEKGCRVLDGTCPFVRKARERGEFLVNEGYEVFLVGDPDHPEVQGMRGYLGGGARVVGDAGDIRNTEERFTKCGVVCQTTQKGSTLAGVVAALVPKSGELRVFNTICHATTERQESVRRLARQVDGIIVIGGRNSANTRKLVEIARSEGAETLWIEHSDEMVWGWLRGRQTIGVAAGASTPDWLIQKLRNKLAISQVAKGEGSI